MGERPSVEDKPAENNPDQKYAGDQYGTEAADLERHLEQVEKAKKEKGAAEK